MKFIWFIWNWIEIKVHQIQTSIYVCKIKYLLALSI